MTALPLAIEAYKRLRATSPEQTVLNYMVEKDMSGEQENVEETYMLLQRPGLDIYQTLPATVQAVYSTANPSFNYNFAVAGNELYTFDGTTANPVGAIGGVSNERIKVVANFDRLIIVSYPNIYCYGPTKTSTALSFRQVAMPDFFGTGAPAVVDVVMKDAYFVFACEDGTFAWLVPGEDTIQALNFATAESDPDGLVGVTLLNNNLIFMGNRTIENWQSTGNADLPFQRTTGQDYARGAMNRDAIVRIDNSIVWVGEDGKCYRAMDVPERVSTDGIEERIKLRTDYPNAWTFSHDGHLFYVLNIPGQGTFAYDVAVKKWSQFSSTDADTLWDPWCSTQTVDTWLAGSSRTANIYTISDSPTDAGVAFPRRATATGAPPVDKPYRVDNVSFDCGASAPCTFNFRWADSTEDLSSSEWVDLSCPKGAQELSYYRMGAVFGYYRTIETEVTDPVVFRLSGIRLGEAWR